MVTINEDEFYNICDYCSELPPLENKYYPKVEELKTYINENNLDRTLFFLIYLAGNPYKDFEEIAENEEYKKTVKYANYYIERHIQIVSAE